MTQIVSYNLAYMERRKEFLSNATPEEMSKRRLVQSRCVSRVLEEVGPDPGTTVTEDTEHDPDPGTALEARTQGKKSVPEALIREGRSVPRAHMGETKAPEARKEARKIKRPHKDCVMGAAEGTEEDERNVCLVKKGDTKLIHSSTTEAPGGEANPNRA
jgi:hypothetical protein